MFYRQRSRSATDPEKVSGYIANQDAVGCICAQPLCIFVCYAVVMAIAMQTRWI